MSRAGTGRNSACLILLFELGSRKKILKYLANLSGVGSVFTRKVKSSWDMWKCQNEIKQMFQGGNKISKLNKL